MCTREVLCEAVEAAQLLRVADIATASLMLVVDADERRSLLSVDDDEFGRGLCEAVIVVFTAAGLMLTFRDSLFCLAGEVEEEEEEATPLALAAGVAAPGRAADGEPEAPTAFRLDVDERPEVLPGDADVPDPSRALPFECPFEVAVVVVVVVTSALRLCRYFFFAADAINADAEAELDFSPRGVDCADEVADGPVVELSEVLQDATAATVATPFITSAILTASEN